MMSEAVPPVFAQVKEVELAARIKEVELAELKKIRRETVSAWRRGGRGGGLLGTLAVAQQ